MGTTHEGSAHLSASAGIIATGHVTRDLAMTPEADKLLAELARRIGRSEGDVLRLALGMFKVAVEAREAGKHVGVARSPEALDLELVGF